MGRIIYKKPIIIAELTQLSSVIEILTPADPIAIEQQDHALRFQAIGWNTITIDGTF